MRLTPPHWEENYVPVNVVPRYATETGHSVAGADACSASREPAMTC